jgi:hypothetical protein
MHRSLHFKWKLPKKNVSVAIRKAGREGRAVEMDVESRNEIFVRGEAMRLQNKKPMKITRWHLVAWAALAALLGIIVFGP